jgi:hypothetical protein
MSKLAAVELAREQNFPRVSMSNELRIHRSLDKDAPSHREIERLGVITSQAVLGGLHHQYCRI